jgi:hypothetical protein
MISSVLAAGMALWMQPADTTRTSREAFTGCMRAYVDQAMSRRASQADFDAAFPQQCTDQQTAFRTAVIARERASRSSQAQAEESASMEIEDARTNFHDRFEGPPVTATAAATPPAAAATPAATASAAPAATPPATPASATTPPR